MNTDFIAGLFRPSAHADEQDAWLNRLQAATESILHSPRVSSGIPTAELAARFAGTEVPATPLGFEAYGRFLSEAVLPHSVNIASTLCLGHMSGRVPEFAGALAACICRLNQNLVRADASRAATLLERQTLAMMHRVLFERDQAFYERESQNPESTLGIACSGGSTANLTALWCARNRRFPPRQQFTGIEDAGVAAALQHHAVERAVIVGSELLHYSVAKAAAILGLGTAGLLRVPVDGAGRLQPGALRTTLEECEHRRWAVVAVVAVAGNTDCGSVDPIEEIEHIARRRDIHLHVDAAWGGALLFSQRYRSKLAGVERADSVVIDGHKQFCLPLGCSIVLLSNPRAAQVLRKQADYILRERSDDLGKFTLEGSRPANSMYLHAALHLFGWEGLGAMIDGNLQLAQAMAHTVAARSEFELLQFPETNIVVYRYMPFALRRAARRHRLDERENAAINAINEAIQDAQRIAGRSLVSRTTLHHLPEYRSQPIIALRAVLGNPGTTLDDADAILEEQAQLGADLEPALL